MLTSLTSPTVESSAKIYEDILELTVQGIYVVQVSHQKKMRWLVNYMNQNAHEVFDIGGQELLEGLEGLLKIVHPEDKKILIDSYNELMKGFISIHRSYRIVHPVTKRVIYLDETVKKKENNDTIELYHYLTDISDNKEVSLLLENTLKELNSLEVINRAIIEDKDLEQISTLFLEAFVPMYNFHSCRIYLYDEKKPELTVLNEKDKTGTKQILENTIGIKLKNISPDVNIGSHFQKIIQENVPVITSDELEIICIVKAHTNSAVFKKFAEWSIKFVNIKTFGIIPLRSGDKTIGILTFTSGNLLKEEEKKSIIRYTEHISGGMIKKMAKQLLAEQELFANEILNNLPIDIAILDKNNKYRLINKTFMPDDTIRKWAIGKSPEELYHWLDKDEEMLENKNKMIQKIDLEHKEWTQIEKKFDENDVPKSYLRVIKSIQLNNTNNKVIYSIDVTELTNIQENLEETQRIAKLGGFEINPKTGMIKLDHKICKMLGIQEDIGEIELKNFYKHIDANYRKDFLKTIHTVTLNKKVENIEFVFKDAEQRSIDISFNAIAIENKSGGIVHLKGTIQDITERKASDAKLKAEHELLIDSQEIAKVGSWEILFVDKNDWSKNTNHWSDESYRIFGYEPGSIAVSYPFFLEHVHPEDQHLIVESHKDLFIPGKHHEVDYRIILKDGSIKHIHGIFYVVFDEKNTAIKMIGISQDITDRKKLETELEHYNKKLEEEVERQTMELTIANKSLDTFNYSISHDLKTPIRAMEIYMDLLQENTETDNENQEYIEQLNKSIGEIKSMISTLLDFAKYSKSELNKADIDMNNKIKNCINSIVVNNSPQKAQINILQTPMVYADDSLLTNVLSNLISNAIKYSSKKENPMIEISGFEDEYYTTYYIKDNGDGFDEKLKSKLFKPFSRLHNDSEFEGSGAGLAIVERIISRHGGDIWAESEKGKGATFYFKLPKYQK